MHTTFIICITLIIMQEAVGPPVIEKKKSEEHKKDENEVNENEHLGTFGIEYNRYLKEVVTALESDPEFREKLEKAEEVDIRTGKIAQELEYVNHQVRTKLDELKRQELERLRHLANKEHALRNNVLGEHASEPVEHVDHSNPYTFEIEDLRKLIKKTTDDLAEADRKRRDEFKEYEMQKEFEKQEKLKELDEEQKKQLESEMAEQERKHKAHKPLHHPGGKQQLEEVWEKQDHMENQDFDPKTFFYLHDLDGNGLWDEEEVKALFLKELDKLYNSGAPEDDMRERVEEMERMREHVFSEADTNKDGHISYQEFLAQTQKPDFQKDQGWEGLDQQQVYTHEEYQEFERRRHQEVQRMIEQGLFHPGQMHPNQLPQGQFHPGQGPQGQMHPAQMAQGQMPQGQVHPGQMARGQLHPGQVGQGQLHPGQVGQGQLHPGQVGQGQLHPGQVGQGQLHPGQVGQGQLHPGQVGQGQLHPGQVGQGQLHPGQMPQGQLHPGQIPQGHVSPGQIVQDKVKDDGLSNQIVQEGHKEHEPEKQAQAIVQQHHQQPSAAPSLSMPNIRHPPQPIKDLREPVNLNQL